MSMPLRMAVIMPSTSTLVLLATSLAKDNGKDRAYLGSVSVTERWSLSRVRETMGNTGDLASHAMVVMASRVYGTEDHVEIGLSGTLAIALDVVYRMMLTPPPDLERRQRLAEVVGSVNPDEMSGLKDGWPAPDERWVVIVGMGEIDHYGRLIWDDPEPYRKKCACLLGWVGASNSRVDLDVVVPTSRVSSAKEWLGPGVPVNGIAEVHEVARAIEGILRRRLPGLPGWSTTCDIF